MDEYSDVPTKKYFMDYNRDIIDIMDMYVYI